MSLWAEYIKDREGAGCVEHENGFITYTLIGKECYIQDIYVRPEFRQTHVAATLANQVTAVAKSKGCEFLTCQVIPSAGGATTALKVILAYGFELLRSDPDRILLVKKVN